MITDAVWVDIDNDLDPDLVTVGEYMPVKVLENHSGRFVEQTGSLGLNKTNGWWNRIRSADLDNDGDLDFIIGNHGLNTRFRADSLHPVSMYIADFDNNGTVEQIICSYNGEVSYPMALRHDLIAQIPSLKKKYNDYESYKDQSFTDIFSKSQTESALHLQAFTFSTSVLLNNGKQRWKLSPLPAEAQYSVTYGIAVLDYDEDGNKDLLLGGNLFGVKPEVGRYDGSYSALLSGDGRGNFKFVPNRKAGMVVDGEVRDILLIDDKVTGNPYIVFSRNNESILFYRLLE
jgi:enediyne biosynthesis protein E4